MASPMTPGSGSATQCLEAAADNPTFGAVDKGGGSCFALHATSAAGACTCPADQGLIPATEAHKKAATKFTDAMGTEVGASCVCEVKQLTTDDAAAFKACTNDVTNPLVDADGKAVNGFCYLRSSAEGTNGELLSDVNCTGQTSWGIRFVGRPATQMADDLSVVLVCSAMDCAGQPQ